MIRPKNNKNKKRVQIVFTKDWIMLLDQLKEKTGASSRAEVVRDAIALLDLVTVYAEEGYEITAIKEEDSDNHLGQQIARIQVPKARFPLSLSNTSREN